MPFANKCIPFSLEEVKSETEDGIQNYVIKSKRDEDSDLENVNNYVIISRNDLHYFFQKNRQVELNFKYVRRGSMS